MDAPLPPPPGEQPARGPWWRRPEYAVPLGVLALIVVLAIVGALVGVDDQGPADVAREPVEGEDDAETVRVPDVGGMVASEARGVLRDAGFRVQSRVIESDDHDPQTVVRTRPAAGSEVQTGPQVLVSIAREPDPAPDVDDPEDREDIDIAEAIGPCAGADMSEELERVRLAYYEARSGEGERRLHGVAGARTPPAAQPLRQRRRYP